MARLSERLPENAEGDFYVDASCIDCETCMVVAPEVFDESSRAQAFVHHQPITEDERQKARLALIACPTASIGSRDRNGLKEAARAFPVSIEGEVAYCGYASEASFGAQTYFLRRPGGNVLVDSPRASKPLFDRLSELGGVATLVLTHRDDVADHALIRERFGCERILHREDVGPGTRGVERIITGDEPTSLGDDLQIIPVPGHTRGSVAVLYKGAFLFSGDHVWGDGRGGLSASHSVCWYSWAAQTRSMKRLLDVDFTHVLPGHGRRYSAATPEAARADLASLIERMERIG